VYFSDRCHQLKTPTFNLFLRQTQRNGYPVKALPQVRCTLYESEFAGLGLGD
jgi:hypothetical protein